MKDFIEGFLEGFGEFGHNFTFIINSILLSFVYFVGVGITSIFAKIVGKHFLDTKLSKKKKSYWSDLNLGKNKMEDYYRQF